MQSNSIHIIHIAAYYPPHLGGLERVAQEVAEQLAREGYPTTVLSSDIGARSATSPPIPNLTVKRLWAFEFAHTAFIPGLFWQLMRVRKPAIFHLHLSQAYVPEMVWLVSKIRNIPYVVHFHLDVEPSGRLGPVFILWKKWIQTRVIQDARHVITLSPDQTKLVCARYQKTADQVTYISNGVGEQFLNIGKTKRKYHIPLRLLFVGRLSVQKRLERLIRALPLITAPVTLTVVGDGEDRATHEELVAQLGLQNVVFRGALFGNDLLEAYKEADIFILPSEKEGMPLAVLEAMASGLPVIGSNVVGIRELVSGVGITVQEPYAEGFAKAVGTLYNNPSEGGEIFKIECSESSRILVAEPYQATRDGIRKYVAMKNLSFTPIQIAAAALIWWALFAPLSLFTINNFEVLNIVGFLFLAIVPGALTILVLDIKGLPFWGYAILALAFSLLELMLVGLIGNTLLPYIGIARPLDKVPVLCEVSVLIVVLVRLILLRTKEIIVPVRRYVIFDSLRHLTVALTPIVFVILSVFGAIRLNDGGNNILTMIMLGGITLYLLGLLVYAMKLGENVIPTALFFISLALLFMTSLRGWYITGHDIQSEYKVFQLAKNAGLWNVAVYRDAYNACLSITILPTVLSNLLSVPDPYIYKIFSQIFFACAPVLVYLTARHWTGMWVSLMGAIFFVGFPTFFTDMPFLTRQETAFIFYGLMLYLIFNPNLRLNTRRWLFMAMGIGVILSHYSTTYTVLIIFGLAVLSRPFFLWLIEKWKDKKIFRNSALIIPAVSTPQRKPKITLTMVGILFVLSFLWTSIITNTGSGVTSVIEQTFAAVQNGFGGDNRSIDVATLLTFGTPNQTTEFQNYIAQIDNPIRAAAPEGVYYPEASYSQYPLTLLPDETTPLTHLGQDFEDLGINIPSIVDVIGQILEKLMEVLVPIGMLYLLLRNRIVASVDDELYALAFFSLVFIALNIILPVLSTEYGIFRAMQQSMFIIAPIIALGVVFIADGLTRGIQRARSYVSKNPPDEEKIWNGAVLFAIGFTVLFFFYSTHLMPYLFGDTSAVLHLSNTGAYYDDYLIQGNEVAGVTWLNGVTGSDTGATQGVRLVIQPNANNEPTIYIGPSSDILPEVIREDSYVFLGPVTVNNGRATVIYNSDEIDYAYPVQFLDANKNLVYSNGGASIYQ